jgi:hypothetical protein
MAIKIEPTDPPGTRIVGGKKLVPFQKPPRSKYPTARAGNYVAPVDPEGMDPEMQKTLGVGRRKPK